MYYHTYQWYSQEKVIVISLWCNVPLCIWNAKALLVSIITFLIYGILNKKYLYFGMWYIYFAWCILFVGDFSHNVHEIPNFATILIKVLFINILSMEWIKLMSIKIEIKQYNCSFSSFRIFRIKIHWKLDFSPLWIVECRYICMGKWGVAGGWRGVREN